MNLVKKNSRKVDLMKNNLSHILEKILKWAENEVSIRALILVGSRAQNKVVDSLSDYDLSIFTSDGGLFLADDQWLSSIGKVWVCVHEKVTVKYKKFPTRLVIFEGGIKVDFSFFPMSILNEIVNSSSLIPEYDRGYSVLLDKDSTTEKMSPPRFVSDIKRPSENDFFTIIKEFWFEVYHVAVYLKRDDLWSAQFRLSGINNQFLLKMIEWNELSKLNWCGSIPPQGKRMHSWISEDTWDSLQQSFAPLDEQDIWNALSNTMVLFRKLATETALPLGYKYPLNVDNSISKFINDLRS